MKVIFAAVYFQQQQKLNNLYCYYTFMLITLSTLYNPNAVYKSFLILANQIYICEICWMIIVGVLGMRQNVFVRRSSHKEGAVQDAGRGSTGSPQPCKHGSINAEVV